MVTLWSVVDGLLWLVAVGNLLLVLGLVSRVRLLEQATRARRPTQLPGRGQRIQPFAASTESGAAFTDRTLEGREKLVGFFTAGCRACEQVKESLLRAPPALPLVAFVQGSAGAEEAAGVGAALREVGEVVYFEDPAVPLAFGAVGFPALVRVEDGVVLAAGRRLGDVLP